ncbi:hypothetical protein HCN44_009385 [Aphidius gifuensis]|uniref:Centromere protein I n=1 Tax=Aphidius gifuensis TaxID=684658 RepID=A0A834Y768_APHGI|nr:hypothetical protein HCN44_009385 [Aphidius gifuensis]
MSEIDRLEVCLDYLENVKGYKKSKKKGKSPVNFEENVTNLQEIALTRGLNETDIEIIINVIKNNDLRVGLIIPLIESLIPINKISKSTIDNVVKYLINKSDDIPVTISTLLLQWFVGLWEYQLIDKKILISYYDIFFYLLLKKKKLESQIAKLIYILTKPEDVTRRQVTRLLYLQSQYKKSPKHIIALLSLFKSYKPELVPEKIQTINIESVWKCIPNNMIIGFDNAKKRNLNDDYNNNECYCWNLININDKTSKKKQQLIPSIRYFNIGSNKFNNKYNKLLFDLNNFDDIGRYYFNVKLPTNATSLLANVAGYHFLTYTSYEYQSRFSHNLYYTLKRAFIIETDYYSNSQKNILLDMTIECCRYMQFGIPVVVRFLNEYLPYECGKYRFKILRLIEWSTFISTSDFDIVVGPYLKSAFFESSIENKCVIIKSLTALTENLFINQKFGKTNLIKASPFLGQVPTSELNDLIQTIVKIVDNLIVIGLNVHQNNIELLSVSIGYYETFNNLIINYKNPMIHLPPVCVFYAGLVSKNCLILSRICGLLLQYRDVHDKIDKLGLRNEFINEINDLYTIANDLDNVLWFDNAFVDRHEGKFVPNLPNYIVKKLEEDKVQINELQKYLGIRNHLAFLPHLSTLMSTGLNITTNEVKYFSLKKLFFHHKSFMINSSS